ncbi:outer membrane protein assembly factor BamC [Aestuariicella hydrocarbonica]|uniref:Outer membrane protein assembly factor BamC n=1 Tax=Pseudomaricurvus hydrocarbonicus TaxID=1470433 RepID=A0A9E5JV53_9GAMM|nr:outer membrane protein assembly factor BamC [Aestuariicella hydrocarbonica]NHO65141.1 outer membrane protein assembly factor BamC [Aestuariicella hydrocarbonica]
MMNRLVLRVALLAAVGGVSGCSSLFGQEGFFRDRGDDYLNADMVPPMKLPAGVSEQGIQQLYVVPQISNKEVDFSGTFEVPRPQALSDSAFTDRVKIQKLGEKRWILVSASPAEVWPQVRSFLSRNNLEVVYTDATNGVIETGWLKFKGDEEFKDKYRLQIEQGVQPDSTEIHVLHMSVAQDTPGRGQVNWPASSANLEREAWMMDELAATIASDGGSGQAASLLAQTIGLSGKVNLEAGQGEPYLHLMLDYARAWATVGHAVNQDGFTLWESDDVVGVYYVNFDPAATEEGDDEPGFFSGLFGGDEEPRASSPYSLREVLAHLQLDDTAENRQIFSSVSSTSAEKLKDVPGYLVVVRGSGDDIKVRIRDGYARNLPARDAKKLLNIIRNNLI